MQIPVVLPLAVISLGDRLVRPRPRIVDENIGAAKLGRCGDELVATAGGRNVAGDRKRSHRSRVGYPHRLCLSALRTARRENDVGAFRREPFRNGQPDADASAGYDGSLAAKTEIHLAGFLK
jgi:hypothetical protein